MTEIKLMNYGRSAGKTYTLNKWVEASKQRLLISNECSLPATISRIIRNQFVEVAFDDFDLADPQKLFFLTTVLQMSSVKTVILATSHATMETEGAISTEAWRKVHGYPAPGQGNQLLEAMARAAEEVRVGKAVLDGVTETKDSDIHAAAEKAEIKRIKEEASGELEPIQSVRVKDLRLGDWVVGKGAVTGIYPSSLPGEKGQLRVLLEDKMWAFNGSMMAGPDILLDVDITKRK